MVDHIFQQDKAIARERPSRDLEVALIELPALHLGG
jgi:hypothetical protein